MVLLFFAVCHFLYCDRVLDNLELIPDPIAFNSSSTNDVARSVFIAVTKSPSSNGLGSQVTVRLYTPVQSSNLLGVIENNGLANIRLMGQSISYTMAEVLARGGVFIPALVESSPNQSAAESGIGYSLTMLGLVQTVDIVPQSPTFLEAPSSVVANNNTNLHKIAVNLPSNQNGINVGNNDTQPIVFANFFATIFPMQRFFANSSAYFSKDNQSISLVNVGANEKKVVTNRWDFFLAGASLNKLSQGTFAYQFVLKMVPNSPISSTNWSEEKQQEISNSQEEIGWITNTISTINGQLQDTNQLRPLTSFEKGIFLVRKFSLLKQRVFLTEKFLVFLQTLQKIGTDPAFQTTIGDTIKIYKDFKMSYAEELQKELDGANSIIQDLEKRVDTINALEEKQRKVIKDTSSLEELNQKALQEIGSFLNTALENLEKTELLAETEKYIAYQAQFLLKRLYREYHTQKWITDRELDKIRAQKRDTALIGQIDALLAIEKKRLKKNIFPSMLLAILEKPSLQKVNSKSDQLKNLQKNLLAVTTLPGYEKFIREVRELEKTTNTIFDLAIEKNVTSILLQEFYQGQSEFFLGLTDRYLQNIRELNAIKTEALNNNDQFRKRQEAIEKEIKNLKKAQQAELEQEKVEIKKELNQKNIRQIEVIATFIKKALAEKSVTLWQVQYYHKIQTQLTTMLLQERSRQEAL